MKPIKKDFVDVLFMHFFELKKSNSHKVEQKKMAQIRMLNKFDLSV